ncbi:hypothetical protein JIG36_31725 [Actinoplanes sp. LDG1-06]|uniref:YdhG-like domain-containing protein n=1 Tax=Paractinoplanes ovalisporus TaxID=2810368 RepID=A0ABS2AL63_9ACTN|nr:hypothetical protein [Actinoplanes ovalisporus]MBM2620093.1 hypothetical protein [Actinoplanes ovalisporus]
MAKVDNAVNKTEEVDAFMADLDHPFKPGVELIRAHIKAGNKGITEQVKWNAPSFSYKGVYLTTFNLFSRPKVFLVFHHPHVVTIDDERLEGKYPDRRLLFFDDLADAKKKKPFVRSVVTELIKTINK